MRISFILLVSLAVVSARLLWHAPRCTGPTPADRCPLAGSVNTSLKSYRSN